VWAVLLVLRNGRFPLDHLHFHSSRHEELTSVLTVGCFLLLLSKDGVALRVVAALVVLLLLMVSYALSRRWNIATSRLVTTGATTRGTYLSRVLVVGVQLMNVQGVASLVHVGVVVALSLIIAIDLNSLSPVAFLRVQLASSSILTDVDRLDK
jgi:hypothetical protein